MTDTRKINPLLKSGLELGPIVLFFVAYLWLKDRVFTIGGSEYEGFILVTAGFIPVILLSTLLLWRLSCGQCWRGYFGESNYYPEIKYVQRRLAEWDERRWRDDNTGNHVIAVAREWRRDLIDTLKDMILWWPQDDAAKAPVDDLKETFQEQWVPMIESRYADLLKRFDAEMAMIGNEKVTRLR